MDRSRFFDGLKFMWDGGEYDHPTAADRRKAYEAEGFSVQPVEEGGSHYLFTRRVVKEVVVAPS